MMRSSDRPVARFVPSLSFVLLLMFVGVLWLAGGASRGDVAGQAVVRGASWACLVALILLGRLGPLRRGRATLLFLAAAVALALAQLVPLPPGLWSSLPGRAVFGDAAAIAGGPPPWRPLAIVPSAALNALGSLIVPLVALCFAAGVAEVRDETLVKLLLGMVVACMFTGLLQFAGLPLYVPLVNGGDEISGTFANRNHFALLMAGGMLLAPAWAFLDGRAPGWRGPAAIALILLLALAILASGSRAGMVVGLAALGCSLVMVGRPLRRALGRRPRWVFPALIAGIVAVLGLLVVLSVAADRAVSINRALTIDPGQDMRQRGLSTVLVMVRDYWPLGAGSGGFDAVFRVHEPLSLLKPTYFNRAHNDFLEIVLDAGAPGLVLLLAGLGWWLAKSVGAWRAGSDARHMLPKLGSALLLIILMASAVDYPARTPMVMAVAVIAGVWLGEARMRREVSALPKSSRHL